MGAYLLMSWWKKAKFPHHPPKREVNGLCTCTMKKSGLWIEIVALHHHRNRLSKTNQQLLFTSSFKEVQLLYPRTAPSVGILLDTINGALLDVKFKEVAAMHAQQPTWYSQLPEKDTPLSTWCFGRVSYRIFRKGGETIWHPPPTRKQCLLLMFWQLEYTFGKNYRCLWTDAYHFAATFVTLLLIML